MRWVWAILLGLAVGVAAALADAKAGGLQQSGAWRALSLLLNAGSVWAAVAIGCGWMLVIPTRAAIAGFLGLMSAVGGYYVGGVTIGDRVDVGLRGVSGAVRFWLLAAAVVGPVLGLVGAISRRKDNVGTIAAIVAPLGVIVEMVWARPLGASTLQVDPWLGWTQVALVVAAAGAVAMLLARRRA